MDGSRVLQAHEEKVDHEKRLDKSIIFFKLTNKIWTGTAFCKRTGYVDVTQAHEEKVEHENRLDKSIVFFNSPTKYGREQCFASGRGLWTLRKRTRRRWSMRRGLTRASFL